MSSERFGEGAKTVVSGCYPPKDDGTGECELEITPLSPFQTTVTVKDESLIGKTVDMAYVDSATGELVAVCRSKREPG